jgi:two-component system sensor histidine kinase KdpD
MNATSRPNPDDILRVVQNDQRAARRGQLKIFFGASAGVGKTYAMLEAAHAARRGGLDVVVGIVETHGRPETERILLDLPCLPRRMVNYRDVAITEFDLETALARKPAILVLDEMAHTNAPGSRHPKRWQDIVELLDAGIDVYTTLNVQHLESLNDVVVNITGVDVQETVPDEIFDEADDIKLVDIPTDELLERLKQGKVYIAEGAADRAAQNFFSKTNLMSLRELALRRTAEYVDADTDDQRIRAGLFTPNIAGDRILVCVGGDALAAKLVRTGRRIATSLKAPWTVLTIENDSAPTGDRQRNRKSRALRIGEQNGAQIVTLQEDRIGEAILAYARSKGITKILIGKIIRSPWIDWFKGSLAEYVIRHSGDIDVYVITGTSDYATKEVTNSSRPSEPLAHYIWSLVITAGFTLLGVALDSILEPIDQVMLYLIGVVIAATRLGRLPALLTALMSVLSLNFFFVVPLYTFDVANASYWLTFSVMLITSWVISSQAGRLRIQTLNARRREKETQALYALSKELSATRGQEKVIQTAIKHIQASLNGEVDVWLPSADGVLKPQLVLQDGEIRSAEQAHDLKQEMIAKWCFEHIQPAGLGTNTMPSAVVFFYPIRGTGRTFGALSFRPAQPNEGLSSEERATIEACAYLLATVLDRVDAATEAEESRLSREAAQLKNTFLSSMSHDLRTPLSTIRGAAEALVQQERLPEKSRQVLYASIYKESDRLTRIVNNLLDLTRYEAGNMILKSEPYYLPELIGAAIKNCEALLKNITIDTAFADEDSLLLKIDGLLIEQLTQNLIENAAAHSPAQAQISIRSYKTEEGLILDLLDQGPGIPPGFELKIFDKFFTMQQHDRPKGAGLGLAICQAIIQLHGGRIWVDNSPLGGACFHVLFPSHLIVHDMPADMEK